MSKDMNVDIVIPDNNEAQFIAMAKRLGYSALVFAYDRKHELPKAPEGLRLIKAISVDVKTGGRPNAEAIISRMPDRALIERLRPDLIYDLEQDERKDYMHQRNSGLNHIIAAFCKKHDISVGFSMASLLEEKNRPRVIGRMRQNIRICRKFKLHMAVASFARDPMHMRSPNDLASLFATIGMHQKEAKDSLILHDEKN